MAKRTLLRRKLEKSQIAFTKYFFRVRKEAFVPGDHHAIIDDVLGKLERGELKGKDGQPIYNLLITIAPRFGKTQIAVIDWMARGIARNPKAKFLHLSYSDDLALDNSSKCRDTVQSPEFMELWPARIRSDTDSKKKWYTEEGGGVYATASGGPITGFGAGSIADGFSADPDELDEFEDFFGGGAPEQDDGLFYGAIVIDDPIKVDDAYNEKLRSHVNNRLNTTIKSRRNNRKTPIVIIMQRLHEDDMAGFVLNGGMGEEFYHLNLPAITDFNMEKDERSGKIVVKGKSLWSHKHTLPELSNMLNADYGVFMAQYMQDPTPEEGTFFKAEWFENTRFRLGQEPTKLVKYGAGDYAVTENTGKNEPDWSEQAVAGFDIKEDLWFLDWWEGQVTLDKSIDKMLSMMRIHDPMLWAAESGVIRRSMEPFLKEAKRRARVHVKNEWLPASASKAANAKAFQALCSEGRVHIPYGPWGDALIAQLLKFTGHDDKRDDKVDVCGLFGRLLNQTFGPAQYHEQLNPKGSDDDYGFQDDGDDGYSGGGSWQVN